VSIAKAFSRKIDVVISCLGCHSGLASDFFKIDYEATLNVLQAALANGTKQFILLSAICVRQPELPLQLAKLKMEDELMRSGINYTIVRPTAYFWVFDVQTRMILRGRPGMLIGSGEQARHNPIAKEDLADFMVGSIDNEARRDRVFVIGGPTVPDNLITSRSSLEMLFEAMGKPPRLLSVPDWLIIAAIRLSGLLGHVFRKAGVFSEFLKIIYYYEVNDMLAPGYGSITFRQHVAAKAQELAAEST
jgi:divinyl chlorophyllide a 8-vinyl-reductase